MGQTQKFSRKITAFSFAYNIALGAGLILWSMGYSNLFWRRISRRLSRLVALTIGLVFNYILFWNRPLLLSLGLAGVSRSMSRSCGWFIKLAYLFGLCRVYGVAAAGALLSFYYIASVGVMVWRGIDRNWNKMKIALITNSRIPSLTANSIQAMKVAQA
jgi:hypothetical protein